MIPVMNSKELNNIFQQAQDKHIKFEQELQALKNDISKKINIIKYENAFINQKLDVIDTGLIAKEQTASFINNSYGSFNSYGYMVHPKFKKTPTDIINLKLPNGDNFFRDGIIAKVNNVEKNNYASVLMADNHIAKTIVFEEFDTDTIRLEYSLANEYTLGVMRFNTIEIDPYLYGAYDLMSIEIFTLDETNNITADPSMYVTGFDNIGKTRIILNEKVKFTKVVFNFKINFKVEKNFVDVYPFGLKHIHFYEADYSESSFVITQITSDRFVEYVMDEMILYTTQGKQVVNASQLGIEVYTDYESNTLMGKVNLSSEAAIYRIAKNTKTLYVKIPLLIKNEKENSKQYFCLNGIELKYNTNQEIIL